VGIVVPDGKRAYLSLLLQQAIPAKIAGVKRIVMVSPADEDLRIHPTILVAGPDRWVLVRFIGWLDHRRSPL
jgi:histidinol dehydrogenase